MLRPCNPGSTRRGVASNYHIDAQTQTVQVLGDGTTKDIMDVVFTTIPSGVTVGYYLPLQLWGDSVGNTILESNAAAVETARNLPNVVGLTVNEDVDVSGLLLHFANVYVSSDSGNSTAVLTVRLDRLFASDFPNDVADLAAKLNATETG